jgi:hypothetical protein
VVGLGRSIGDAVKQMPDQVQPRTAFVVSGAQCKWAKLGDLASANGTTSYAFPFKKSAGARPRGPGTPKFSRCQREAAPTGLFGGLTPSHSRRDALASSNLAASPDSRRARA